MESLFYVYFRKWCSRASQIAFHDCQKKLQNHVFSRIVHLASTRALVLEWSHHQYSYNQQLCLNHMRYRFFVFETKDTARISKNYFWTIRNFSCYECPVYYSQSVFNVIGPWPLYYFNFCYLQSRHSTKCNVLM